MLEVSHLRVRYGRMLAVSDISLSVPAGKLVAVVGANGAGKSTTLRAISGLVRPDQGEIRFDGRSIVGARAHSIARLGIAHVPEGRGLLPSLTVDENLRLGSYGRAAGGDIAADRERIFGYFPALRARLAQPASVLSGGEQQMLSIARALLKAPRLLMIDEMSLGLAPRLAQQIMEVVVELARSGIAVLCVEQNTRLVLRHADHGYVIETGKTVLEGSGAELLANDGIANAYLGSAQAAGTG
ncbi:ABC transporter ATP-binding protein [Bosea sp. (in: a-proteobacteria)]|uniref:ABC transporter ATP-binding protein n=1 Tax=Bosea sp. (in: a-proteobacteria) TaxID=1871050 RepID=UPI002606CE57|nr:ABC transporter ATP-binding protein [Bosea sp. (in: a-proteobacteria)]MCO5089665.1 ABC transporter ATP-binding protein [Bosea sp. (in: a-proteobacteria)]